MRVYKRMIIITSIIAIISFLIAIIMQYGFLCDEKDFWINVFLGIFGGAVLTILTSLLSYNYEKIKTLENFLYHTRQLLFVLNKYQENMTLEEKIKFFLDYSEVDKIEWDTDLGNIDFFFEKVTRNREYIYYSIYKPILDFNNAVIRHIWHFRWHLDGSGKNDVVMQSFVLELQEYLLETEERSLPVEHSEDGNDNFAGNYTLVVPRLVCDVKKELEGRYSEILYGRKVAGKVKRNVRTEERNNGKNENGVA